MFGLEVGMSYFAAIVIGWFLVQGLRSAGKKLSSLSDRPAEHRGCRVYKSSDYKYYELCYSDPNHPKKYASVKCGSVQNHIASLEYDGSMFTAVAQRVEFIPKRILNEETFKAPTLIELSKAIEERFLYWDKEDGKEFMWNADYESNIGNSIEVTYSVFGHDELGETTFDMDVSEAVYENLQDAEDEGDYLDSDFISENWKGIHKKIVKAIRQNMEEESLDLCTDDDDFEYSVTL